MHEDDNQIFAHGTKHSYLEEVLEMVSRSEHRAAYPGSFFGPLFTRTDRPPDTGIV